ncbi:MAG TPA: carbohydrate kinase family protein [Methanocella sp.]|nr:carbohydrate kinase family protein [Methanocella sp.]
MVRYDVSCYGAMSVDVSGQLRAPLVPGTQAEATDYRLSPGGDATLVALTLAGLGLKVFLAGGPVCRDSLGRYFEVACGEAGVDIAPRVPGQTSITAVALEPSGARTSITFHEASPLATIPVPADRIASSRFLYADGCYGENAAAAGAAAREHGVPSLLNLFGPTLDFVGLFDVVVANEGIAGQIAGDPLAAAEIVRAKGAGLAIVTMGERGCICSNDGLLTVPAFPAEAVDTTGAGAAFAAGFIYARLQSFNVLDSLRIASAAGAYKCAARGSYRRFSEKELFVFIGSRE